jgi:putative transposase
VRAVEDERLLERIEQPHAANYHTYGYRRTRKALFLDALRTALSRRQAGADVQLIHRSDAGSQYTSYAVKQVLDDHGVVASVGTAGDAYDNAMAESDRVWRTRTQLELAIVEWDAWFNTDRLYEAVGDLPPVEFEALYAAQARPDLAHTITMETT